MRFIIIILSFLLLNTVYSQNFVTNGNFEAYSNCPFAHGQLNSAIGWHGIWGGGAFVNNIKLLLEY